ncbi:MAG: 2,3-bisphosphoglycerate-dependent phosphoglycerate mutase [Nanoarchaeota archaeon]
MVKLILVRHGQSIWNLENRFTGWADIPLSAKGIKEAKKAGKLLHKERFDIAFTSELLRAQQTMIEILDINDNDNKFFKIHSINKARYNRYLSKHPEFKYLEVHVNEALNERDYGNLEGLNKDETRKKYGAEKVHLWRRSYDVPPPGGECLKDTAERTIPYYKKEILKQLKGGKNVLVTAHGNSLRALIMFLEKMTPEQILEFELPTGVPRVYEFDKNMKIKKVYFLK